MEVTPSWEASEDAEERLATLEEGDTPRLWLGISFLGTV